MHRDLLYLYYCYTRFMYKPILPKNRFVEGDPWYGPVNDDYYQKIKKEIILNQVVLKELRKEEL